MLAGIENEARAGMRINSKETENQGLKTNFTGNSKCRAF